jgi:hypothetical protein
VSGDAPPQKGAILPQEMMIIGGETGTFHGLHQTCPIRLFRSIRDSGHVRALLPDQIHESHQLAVAALRGVRADVGEIA